MFEDITGRLVEGKPLSDRELFSLILLELLRANGKLDKEGNLKKK